MRVGLVCEGPTDVEAIKAYLGASMGKRQKYIEFVELTPATDKTNVVAGWHSVLKWLEDNPPVSRVKAYFDGGIFEGERSAVRCDVVVVQLDSDILEEEGFRTHVESKFGINLGEPSSPTSRGEEVQKILDLAMIRGALTEIDEKRHIVAPAVESTETWCIAAYKWWPEENLEEIRGQELGRRFMEALHQSEQRVMQTFGKIDKSRTRRKRFCEKHKGNVERLEQQCYHYRVLLKQVEEARETVVLRARM